MDQINFLLLFQNVGFQPLLDLVDFFHVYVADILNNILSLVFDSPKGEALEEQLPVVDRGVLGLEPIL